MFLLFTRLQLAEHFDTRGEDVRCQVAAQQLKTERREQLGGRELHGREMRLVRATLWRHIRLRERPEQLVALHGEELGGLGGDRRLGPSCGQRDVDVLGR